MAEAIKAGQVHTIPENELEVPPGKRPKVDGEERPNKNAKRSRNRRDKYKNLPEPCSPEDVLWRDVCAVLGQDAVDKALGDKTEFKSPLSFHQEVELDILSLLPSGMSPKFFLYSAYTRYLRRHMRAFACASFATCDLRTRDSLPFFPLGRRRNCPFDRWATSMGRNRTLRPAWRENSCSYLPKRSSALVW
jgi:hypothetical protein